MRWLLSHDYSDALFEVFSRDEMERCVEGHGCDDVTDIPHHEERFREVKKEKALINGLKYVCYVPRFTVMIKLEQEL